MLRRVDYGLFFLDSTKVKNNDNGCCDVTRKNVDLDICVGADKEMGSKNLYPTTQFNKRFQIKVTH